MIKGSEYIVKGIRVVISLDLHIFRGHNSDNCWFQYQVQDVIYLQIKMPVI